MQLSGKRIKANGRIVAAEGDTNPAFAAYYDLHTDETGATKRLGMTVTLAERERQLVVARDEENMWMVTDHQGESRAAYQGAAVPHRTGRRVDGRSTGTDPRRRVGIRGVGIGAWYRPTALKPTPPGVEISAAVA